jgi:hypothetical protein
MKQIQRQMTLINCLFIVMIAILIFNVIFLVTMSLVAM